LCPAPIRRDEKKQRYKLSDKRQVRDRVSVVFLLVEDPGAQVVSNSKDFESPENERIFARFVKEGGHDCHAMIPEKKSVLK
jgi:hypothetical protein